MEVDLRNPAFAIGFHSGWSLANDSPTISLSLTNRKKINLIESESKPIFDRENLSIPFLIKTNISGISGLSSGVGSSLIEFKGNFYKLKRNGYRLEGFKDKIIPDRSFSLGRDFLEETSNEFGGVMSIDDAKREIKIEEELKTIFRIPQKTIALYSIKIPFPDSNDSVAMIQKIDSDLRADEFCIILLTNLFYKIYGNNFLIDLQKMQMFYPKYSIKKGLKILKEDFEQLFLHIGKIIGGIYRKMHDHNYLRGIGNSWYGNEVICPEGNIGICDLESCFSKEEINDEELFEELKKTDINLARTAFYESMNYFENSLASFVAVRLIEGFDKGYRDNFQGKIDPFTIEKQITNFLKIRNIVILDD
jgi:hypothetical protein